MALGIHARRFALPLLLAATSSSSWSLSACTGDGGGGHGKTACANAIDCDLDEACRGGFCVPNVPFDGGTNPDAGTGDGGDEQSAVAAICQRVASCNGDPTQTQDCINQSAEQFREMHAQGSEVCEKVAADLVAFYTCAATATCDELQDSTALAQRCPIFNEVQNEFDQCPIGGEGEGEGEPPPPDQCLLAQGFDPTGTSDSLFLFDVFGSVDATADPNCSTAFSATLQIDFDGDPDAAVGGEGLSSFDQRTVFDTLPLDFSQPGLIRAVACGDDVSLGTVAFQLLLADGTQTNAVCGSLSFP